MLKLFESDRAIMLICALSLILLGIFVHELFWSSLGLNSLLALGSNIATIVATLFAIWAYVKWKFSANNNAVHKLILEFIIHFQSLDLTINRLLKPSSKEQFISDYESWSQMYLSLNNFKKNYCILTNEAAPTFMDLNLPALAILEGRFSKMRAIHIHACEGFSIPQTEGASLLYEFLLGNAQMGGKYNKFHVAWTQEITYQNLSFSPAINEMQSLLHR